MELIDDILHENYNRYVERYNKADEWERERILGILVRNKSEFQERIRELSNEVQKEIEFLKIELQAIVSGALYTSPAEQENRKVEKKASLKLKNQIVKQVNNDVDKHFHIDQPDRVYNKISKAIFRLYEHEGIEDKISKPTNNVRNIISLGKTLQKVESQFRVYQAITSKITDNVFPSELPSYDNLPKSEKRYFQTSDGSPGCDPDEDVPQERVEGIVSYLLEQSSDKGTVQAKVNDQKRMFRVVHIKGSNRGNANVKQIVEYFEFKHPNLMNICGRQFNKRVKHAVPDDMK